MSDKRDELAGIINGTINDEFDPGDDIDGHTLADAILAAGYHKPRTVTAAEELDALPVGSVVLDGDGDPWKKRSDGLWLSDRMLEDSETVFWCGPTPDSHPTVLHEGSAA